MSSLVAYDQSDESSGSESDESGEPPVKRPAAAAAPAGPQRSVPPPGPQTAATYDFVDLSALDKNRSQPIRITIPALQKIDTTGEPGLKLKLKPSTKGSGLFSLLPEPVNVVSPASQRLLPQSVKNFKKPPIRTVKLIKPNIPRSIIESSPQSIKSFFFSDDESLPPPAGVEWDENGDPITPATSSQASGDPGGAAGSSSGSQELPPHFQPEEATYQSSQASASPSVIDHQADGATFDDAALVKLCGTKDRRRGPDLSEIIDIDGAALVGDNSQVFSRELSKEKPTHSFKRRSESSTQQRRKHQITYLAEQAKAQEMELRNNWAQNRVTRKQTQAKYGF